MSSSKENLIIELEINFELKKLKKEQMWLERYLEKNSKNVRFLESEDLKEYQIFYNRYYDVIDRIDELEKLIKEVNSNDN